MKPLPFTADNYRQWETSVWRQGMCNRIWQLRAPDGAVYLLKEARPDPETGEQNDLLTEARLLQALAQKAPGLPIQQVVFVQEQPPAYAYRFCEGRMLREVWPPCTLAEKAQICDQIGRFHANLYTILSVEDCRALGLHEQQHSALDPETGEDLARFLNDPEIPGKYRQLLQRCRHLYAKTEALALPGLCHNDSHHENILVHEGQLSAFLDFGDADYGDVHREFTRYWQDYPEMLEPVLGAFEAASGRRLSRARIVARTVLDETDQLRAEYHASGKIGLLDRLWQSEALDRKDM